MFKMTDNYCFCPKLTDINTTCMEQYKLIRGLLAHNLGEQMEPLGEEEADLLGKTVEEEGQSGELWTTTFMDIELHGVTGVLVSHHAQYYVYDLDCLEDLICFYPVFS